RRPRRGQGDQPVLDPPADRRRRGHGDGRGPHGGAARRQVHRPPAEPEPARLPSAVHQGRAARRGRHRREAQGLRHIRRARPGQAPDGSARADHRQCGLQRGRGMGPRHATHTRQASCRAEGKLKEGYEMRAFELYDANSIKEAIDLLRANAAKNARVVAGGSDLVGGLMKDWVHGKGLALPEVLVDITTIKELVGINEDNGGLTIGAATTLMPLNASAKIDGVNGSKTVSFDEYFTGPRVDVLRENILKPGEFMTHITIPNPPGGVKFGWSKLKDRQVYDFALTSVAVAF